FYALHFHRPGRAVCIWGFDLLYVNGRDLRALTLHERKRQLERIVKRPRADWLQISETFADGAKLLAEAGRMRLEGIVSERADSPYRSGKRSEWLKVKCAGWREANRERWRLFERSLSASPCCHNAHQELPKWRGCDPQHD